MLNREETAQLLMLHSNAYELLTWLADEVSWHPDLLPPKEAELHKPEIAPRWLTKHRNRIPDKLLPAEKCWMWKKSGKRDNSF